jgi:hypothetical protein
MGRAHSKGLVSQLRSREHDRDRAMTLPQPLSQALASISYGRSHAATSEIIAAIKEAYPDLAVAVLECSRSTRAQEIVECLQKVLSPTIETADPQSFELENPRPQVLLLAGADIMPNAAWRVVLAVMKKCARKDWPFLVITSNVDNASALARLYGLDQDSSMMWQSDALV